MITRALSCSLLAFVCFEPSVAHAQGDPTPGLLRAPKLTPEEARDAVQQAKRNTVAQLRRMGGRFAQEAKKLEELAPQVFLERMAVAPPVGPSTIAPVKPDAPTPTPSINAYAGNGATTAHPAVALLLARASGEDLYKASCSGTLIRQNVVLTAAHCICYSRYPQDNYATGAECINGTPDKPVGAMTDPDRWKVFFQHVGLRSVTQVVVAERYTFSGNAIRDDLALLVLDQPVSEINPPSLPVAGDAVPSWGSGEVVGYGFSSVQGSNGIALAQLLHTGIKGLGQVKSSVCTSLSYLEPGAGICSTYAPTQGGSSATVCQGDSGGPLWQPTEAGTEIGVTSGFSTSDCSMSSTVGFQMATSFRRHYDWIHDKLSSIPGTDVKGIWPAFGDNLIAVADRRNIGSFDPSGNYKSGPISSKATNRIVATMNSSGWIQSFSVVDQDGKVLCNGAGGLSNNLPNVNYCWATVGPGTKYQIVAKGESSQYLQFVVSTRVAGK